MNELQCIKYDGQFLFMYICSLVNRTYIVLCNVKYNLHVQHSYNENIA